MASTRNNRVQDRRAALREQHARERKAADAVFVLLDKEEAAREAAAGGVADLVETVGKARAAELLGLTPAEVSAYLTLHRDVTGGRDVETDDAASDDGAADAAGEDAAGTIPAQSEAGAAAAAPASA
ncbi:hypothetical protein [Streptomyces sp. CA2R106]|uniref:hypothetical protein n=1 Tax=Streptomyces sp. CA2R106 TaxID=3120153 RepID=UPI00300AB9EC